MFIHLFSNKHIVNRIFGLSKTSLSWNIALFVILKKCFPYLHVSNEIHTLCYQIIQANEVFLMQPDRHNIMKIHRKYHFVEKCINIVRILMFCVILCLMSFRKQKNLHVIIITKCKNANSRPNLVFCT